MSLGKDIGEQIGRLMNGVGHPDDAAISHLALAAGRAADGLVYLADLDDARFDGVWPDDGYPNAAVDDSHVRWAATQALTSLDLSIAAAARYSGFAKSVGDRQDSVRSFYSVRASGGIIDNRGSIDATWRSWFDAMVIDPRYLKLLRVRNSLTHADAYRFIHGAVGGPLRGHDSRYGYNLGPMIGPPSATTHERMDAREIIELARDTSAEHVTAFLNVLRGIPSPPGKP